MSEELTFDDWYHQYNYRIMKDDETPIPPHEQMMRDAFIAGTSKHVDELAGLRKELEASQRLIDKLRVMLDEVRYDSYGQCAFCGEKQGRGHKPDCDILETIQRGEK